jgi:hypothetical protein
MLMKLDEYKKFIKIFICYAVEIIKKNKIIYTIYLNKKYLT